MSGGGSIEPYPTAQGTRYAVRWRGPDRRQKKKRGFRRKRDAEAFLARIRTEMQDGRYIDPHAGRVTVAELGPAWLERTRAGVAYSTWRTYESAWRLHVEPRWGRVSIAAVRRTDVEDWIGEMVDAGLSHTSVDRGRSVLAGILAGAVAARRIAENPAENPGNMPRKSSREMRILTPTQLTDLAAAAGPHRDLILTLGLTGLRWGEAVALRSPRISLERRRIAVAESAVEAGGEIIVGMPKNHERREVAAPQPLLERLAQADDLTFPGPRGGYLRRPKNARSWWARALRETGLPADLRRHELRHTAASLAIDAGANIKVLQRMLGHASAAMTLDRYGHLMDHALDDVATRMARQIDTGAS